MAQGVQVPIPGIMETHEINFANLLPPHPNILSLDIMHCNHIHKVQKKKLSTMIKAHGLPTSTKLVFGHYFCEKIYNIIQSASFL